MPALTDPRLYEEGDPHTVWRALREHSPVWWHAHPGYPPAFWAVTGYEPGLRVLTDWRRFSSAQGTSLRPDVRKPYPGAGRMLALSDPPRHDILRKAIAGLFSRRAVSSLESSARSVIRSLWSQAKEAGGCDFVTDVAAVVPFAVSADLLGISPEDSAMVTAAAEKSSLEVTGADAQAAHYQVLQYFAQALEDRRRQPGDDLVSAFVRAQANGTGISDEEIILSCDNVVVAVGDTVRLAAAGSLLALLEHPDQYRALRSGAVDVRRAVDELLRWTCPTAHLLRTAVVDTALGGALIRAGDTVTVWLPSVNRDEAVFEAGDTLALDRRTNRHAAFGYGVHLCLGAALARLILRALLAELSEDSAEISLAGCPRRLPSYILFGLTSLPVEIRAR